MFKEVSKRIGKQFERITDRDEESRRFDFLLDLFVEENLTKERAEIVSINYHPYNRCLFIKARNKSVATEVHYKSEDIKEWLSKKGIKLTKVVVS